MKPARILIDLVLLCLCLCGIASADNQYYSVEAPVEISSTDPVVLTLSANEGWGWNITDNLDVTSWLITKDGAPAFADTEGIATAKLVSGTREDAEGEFAVAVDITIDTSKVSGFAVNGPFDLYVKPLGSSSLWVVGNNHGQYSGAAEPAGKVLIPAVSVDGVFTANANNPIEVTNDTVQVVLTMDGLQDSLIDASSASIAMLPGDGYKLTQVEFEAGALAESWEDGKAAYTLGSISGNFSPQGGDGNGHYNFRIGISGIKYNGLPLAETVAHTDYYCFGRTFLTEGGSLILKSQPAWTSDVEIPVLCDIYPDTFHITWPVGFDASGLSAEDISLTLLSAYDDSLTLTPGEEYTIMSSATATDITTTYIYWAYAPVYTTLRVSVSTANLSWNELMYAPGDSFTHDYDIASVFVYNVMSGGPSGTQAWTIFGLKNLTDSKQVYKEATYCLQAVDEDGNTIFYGEDKDGNGIIVDSEALAVAFNCDEECNVHLEDDTVYYTRLFDQMVDKQIGDATITFTKNYVNCETLLRSVKDLIDVELEPGFAIGNSWSDHIKWPWQTFVNVGFMGGSK